MFVNQEELSVLSEYSDPPRFGQIGILLDRLDLQYHLSTCLSYYLGPDIPAMVMPVGLATTAHWRLVGYTEMIELAGDTAGQEPVEDIAVLMGDMPGAIARAQLDKDIAN